MDINLDGEWIRYDEGYYLFYSKKEPKITIFDIEFRIIAIQTTGNDEQTALHRKNEAAVNGLLEAGCSERFVEITVEGKPAIVFLTPIDDYL